MRSSYKIALTFLISLVLTSVFAVLAYTGLFSVLETDFFSERVKIDQLSRLDAISKSVVTWNHENRSLFDTLSRDRYFQSVYSVIQKPDEISFRRKSVDSLMDRLDGFQSLRVVDDDGRIQYSSSAADLSSEVVGERRLYRNWDLSPDAFTLPPISEGSNIQTIYDGENQRIIYLLPSIDRAFVTRGWMVVVISSDGLAQRLSRDGLASPGARVRVINDRGVIVDIRPEQADAVGSGIDIIWPVDESPAEFALLAEGSGENFWLAGMVADDGTWVGRLVPGRLIGFSTVVQILIIGTVFVTFVLTLFLLLNIRQDRTEVLRGRIKRLQFNLIKDWLDHQDDTKFALRAKELESRREEVRRELRMGLGRLKGTAVKDADQLIDDGWTQIIDVLAKREEAKSDQSNVATQGTSASPIDMKQLENMIMRALSEVKIPVSAPPVSEAPVPERRVRIEVVDDGDIEELEDLEDLEDLEEDDTSPDASKLSVAPKASSTATDTKPTSGPVDVVELSADDYDDLDELEEVSDLEDSSDLEEPAEPEQIVELGELADLDEVGEVAELEDLAELEELAESEPTTELDEVAELEKITALEEIAEPEKISELEEVAEPEKITDLEELADLDEIPEENLQEDENLASTVINRHQNIENEINSDTLEESESIDEIVGPEDFEEVLEILPLVLSEDTRELIEIDKVDQSRVYMFDKGFEKNNDLDETSDLDELESVETLGDSEELEELEELEDIEALEESNSAESETETVSDVQFWKLEDIIRRVASAPVSIEKKEKLSGSRSESMESLVKTRTTNILPGMLNLEDDFLFEDDTAVLQWSQEGLDYDRYLKGFKKGATGVYKSLMSLSKEYRGAICGVLLAGTSTGLETDYAVGLDDESATSLSVGRDEELWSRWFASRQVVFVPNLKKSLYAKKTKHSEYRNIRAALFLPAVYNGAPSYIFLGFKVVPSDPLSLLTGSVALK